jgi:hypothetical protein
MAKAKKMDFKLDFSEVAEKEKSPQYHSSIPGHP